MSDIVTKRDLIANLHDVAAGDAIYCSFEQSEWDFIRSREKPPLLVPVGHGTNDKVQQTVLMLELAAGEPGAIIAVEWP